MDAVSSAAPLKGRPRGSVPDRVKQDILAVARREFAENGLSGANINAIADRTATSKRMIYYYFGDKEGLYRAVLEDTYRRIRTFEQDLRLEHLPPADALAKLTGATFDYHADDAEHVRLVMVENIHHAKHLQQLGKLGDINLPALAIVREVYERGVAEGAFRPGINPIDIHLTINGLSFFNVSNRASVVQVFGHDMGDREFQARRRASVIETTLRFVSDLSLAPRSEASGGSATGRLLGKSAAAKRTTA